MDLGKRIKDRRLELDLTLEEVGNKVGVTKSTILKWETGYIENMKRNNIALLAEALKVSPLWIMGIEEIDSSPIEEESISELEEYFDKHKHKLHKLPKNEIRKLIKMIDIYLD